MKISILDVFGMELNDDVRTIEYAKALPICDDGQLEIDFSKCIIDYPATSKIADAAFERIEKGASPRNLTFIFNIGFPERMFLKWFFFGSRRLGLDEGTATEEEIRNKLTESLKNIGAVLHIKIQNPQTQAVVQEFRYGE